MKKYFLPIVLALTVMGSSALAQDSGLGDIELGEPLVVTGLNFTMYSPTGWVRDIGDRVSFTQTEADLAAMIDDDDATQPEGYTITLSSIPKAAFIDALATDDPTLDEVVELLTGSIDVEATFDVPIMARRGASFAGVNVNGRLGIGTVWEVDDFYVTIGMGSPEETLSDDFIALFDAVTASIEPYGDEPVVLSEDTLALGDLGLSLAPLEDWATHEIENGPFVGLGMFADDADYPVFMESGKTTSAAIIAAWTDVDAMPDVAGATAREAAQVFMADMEDVAIEGEFLVGDALGFGFSGVREDQYYYFVTMTPTDETWTFYYLTAPDAETGEAMIPSFTVVLQSAVAE